MAVINSDTQTRSVNKMTENRCYNESVWKPAWLYHWTLNLSMPPPHVPRIYSTIMALVVVLQCYCPQSASCVRAKRYKWRLWKLTREVN